MKLAKDRYPNRMQTNLRRVKISSVWSDLFRVTGIPSSGKSIPAFWKVATAASEAMKNPVRIPNRLEQVAVIEGLP